MTEQIKRGDENMAYYAPFRFSQFGGTPLCVGVFTPTRPRRSEQCVKKGGGGRRVERRGMTVFIMMSQGSKEGESARRRPIWVEPCRRA